MSIKGKKHGRIIFEFNLEFKYVISREKLTNNRNEF